MHSVFFGFLPVVLVGFIVDVSFVGVVEVTLVLVAVVETKTQKIQVKYNHFVFEIILLNSVIYLIWYMHLYELL